MATRKDKAINRVWNERPSWVGTAGISIVNSIKTAFPTQAEIPNNGTILLSDILENIGIRGPK